MDLLTSNALLRSYFLLPHRLLNRSFSRLAMRSRPAWAVQAAIRTWTRRSQLDLRDFEEGPFATVQEFFLRRLREGARPIGPGFVSPVDGFVVAAGTVEADTALAIKGCEMSLERVVNGAGPSEADTLMWSLAPYVGGHYAVLFLTPEGYHHLHMPADGTIVGWRWIPGRFFPQNASALARIAGVYERNERVSLRVRLDDGNELLMVLVGASLVGGIHVDGLDLQALQRGKSEARISSGTTSLGRRKGDELGHFRFGSTIVLVLPPGLGSPLERPEGCGLKMGEALF